MTPKPTLDRAVCESCKETCALALEGVAGFAWFTAEEAIRCIIHLPSPPSRDRDASDLVAALEEISMSLGANFEARSIATSALNAWRRRTSPERADLAEAVHAGFRDGFNLSSMDAKVKLIVDAVTAALASPEMAALRPAREIALVAVTTEVWTALRVWGGADAAEALVDRVSAALEADRRNRP